MRAKRNGNTKEALVAAAVRLGAEGGPTAITIGAIAGQVGVTEAAVYRHFRSKDALLCHAYALIINEMIAEKQHLVASDMPLRAKLLEWVRLAYEYFDRSPEAYMFALLTPHVGPQADQVTTGHSGLFRKLYENACATGEARPIAPELALSHFAGVVLSVPRLIYEGVLKGPAVAYVEEVSTAAWRIFRPESAEASEGRGCANQTVDGRAVSSGAEAS